VGLSSPPGFDVIWVKPPPSEERIVQTPCRLGSMKPASQASCEPSGDQTPQGVKRFGSVIGSETLLPVSGLRMNADESQH
jgi:hypothetical protein